MMWLLSSGVGTHKILCFFSLSLCVRGRFFQSRLFGVGLAGPTLLLRALSDLVANLVVKTMARIETVLGQSDLFVKHGRFRLQSAGMT